MKMSSCFTAVKVGADVIVFIRRAVIRETTLLHCALCLSQSVSQVSQLWGWERGYFTRLSVPWLVLNSARALLLIYELAACNVVQDINSKKKKKGGGILMLGMA